VAGSPIVAPSGGNVGIGFAIPANVARKVVTEV
jgi:S1-C subfamily serine protease